MVLYDNETKARRKNYIRTKELMGVLDAGMKPTQSKTIMHPRWNNKPYSCELGRHDLFTDVLMGIPFLTCRKCGWTTLKAAHEGTATKTELNRPLKNKPRTYLTKDIVDLFYPERRKW